MVSLRNSVKIRKRRAEKTLLKTTVQENVEERTVKRDITGKKSALQIKWVSGKKVHLHCKTCGNSWGRRSGLSPNTKFVLRENTVKCKRCGREWRTG